MTGLAVRFIHAKLRESGRLRKAGFDEIGTGNERCRRGDSIPADVRVGFGHRFFETVFELLDELPCIRLDLIALGNDHARASRPRKVVEDGCRAIDIARLHYVW